MVAPSSEAAVRLPSEADHWLFMLQSVVGGPLLWSSAGGVGNRAVDPLQMIVRLDFICLRQKELNVE